MNKADLEKLIKNHSKWYQKIVLPFGVVTPGRNRSKTANKIFLGDMTGLTVLDIGCAEGFFCLEAKKRGAKKVVGLDFDNDKVQMAKQISEMLNLDIDYINGDLEKIEHYGNFDYIICLNIVHHLTNPIALIEKLIGMSNKKLVLEIADIKTGFSDIGKSEMIQRFKSGDDKTCKLINLNPRNNLRILSAAKLQKNPPKSIFSMLLEHDFYMIILRRYGKFDYDPILRIIRKSKDKTVYILVCSSKQLRTRISKVIQSKNGLKKKDRKKLRRMVFEYSDPDRVKEMFKSWIAFCRSLDCKIKFLNAETREFLEISESEALKIIQ